MPSASGGDSSMGLLYFNDLAITKRESKEFLNLVSVDVAVFGHREHAANPVVAHFIGSITNEAAPSVERAMVLVAPHQHFAIAI